MRERGSARPAAGIVYHNPVYHNPWQTVQKWPPADLCPRMVEAIREGWRELHEREGFSAACCRNSLS